MVHRIENPEQYIIEPKCIPDEPKCIPNEPKCIPNEPKCIPDEPKCILDEPKCILDEPKCIPKNICTECGKHFATTSSLKRHTKDRCKGYITDKYTCEFCNTNFSSVQNKYRHMKKCREEHEEASEASTDVGNEGTTNIQSQVNNIQNQVIQNTNTNNVTYNQTLILNFPETMDDENFKLAKDHMTLQNLEHLFSKRFQPKQGFARYTSAMLERPENRNVYKTSPNTKYNKIWKNGRWEYELDEEVYPLLTYHMTIAALDDINNHKKELKRGGKINYMAVAKCLDDINTENDDNDNYEFALEKLKIAVLNFSERFGLPVCV